MPGKSRDKEEETTELKLEDPTQRNGGSVTFLPSTVLLLCGATPSLETLGPLTFSRRAVVDPGDHRP